LKSNQFIAWHFPGLANLIGYFSVVAAAVVAVAVVAVVAVVVVVTVRLFLNASEPIGLISIHLHPMGSLSIRPAAALGQFSVQSFSSYPPASHLPPTCLPPPFVPSLRVADSFLSFFHSIAVDWNFLVRFHFPAALEKGKLNAVS